MSATNYEYLATRAVASVYGVDIQEDNVLESRERLLDSVMTAFRRLFGKEPTHICQDSIRFILSQNIQCGNTLTYKAQNDEPLMITKVKAMCDLVKDECVRIDSRFLEPACGDGNFLVEILNRKLAVVKDKYRRSAYDWERYSLLALGSLYGVDLLADNCQACRERLFEIWNKEYKKVCKKECNDDTRNAAKFVLERNIVCGDALSLRCVDENQKDNGIRNTSDVSDALRFGDLFYSPSLPYKASRQRFVHAAGIGTSMENNVYMNLRRYIISSFLFLTPIILQSLLTL